LGVTEVTPSVSRALRFAARLGWVWRAGAFVAVSLVMLDITQNAWLGDFLVAYYPAGHAALFDHARLYDSVNCLDGFVNLPIVGALFAPLSALPYWYAAVILTAAGVIAVAASVGLLWRVVTPTAGQAVLLLALVALNGPLWDSFKVGNLTHFVLPLVLLAVLMLIRRRPGAAGVILGVAGVVKIPLGLIGLYFLVSRQWRALTSMAATVAAIVVASVVLFGPAVNRRWVDHCVVASSGKVITHFYAQTLDGSLARAHGANQFSWEPIARTRTHDILRVPLIGATLCALLWILRRLPPDQDDAVVKAAVAVFACAIMIFPASWIHYYVFLLPSSALLVTGAQRVPPGLSGKVLTALALVAVSIPTLRPFQGHSRFGALADQLVVSHYYLGGLLMFALLLYDVASRRQSVELGSPDSTGARQPPSAKAGCRRTNDSRGTDRGESPSMRLPIPLPDTLDSAQSKHERAIA
jgi:hypothetical protein